MSVGPLNENGAAPEISAIILRAGIPAIILGAILLSPHPFQLSLGSYVFKLFYEGQIMQ